MNVINNTFRNSNFEVTGESKIHIRSAAGESRVIYAWHVAHAGVNIKRCTHERGRE